MRPVLLLAMGWPTWAAITNVQAIPTAQQVVLSYRAPDNNACTVRVSTSPTYTPLVPDVDPGVFSGANSDNRPGSSFNGRSRIFVAGKRTTETATATAGNASRSLQAATTHYFQILCGGDAASGMFTTLTIPSGSGVGDVLPNDGAGGYLYPSMSTTDRSASVIDPHTGALVRNMVLPGDMQGGIAAQMSSSGAGVMCHPTPVAASDGTKGYHCQISIKTSSGTWPGLYWIAPSTGETRFLGVMTTSSVTPGWNASNLCGGYITAPFDAADPNTFYCVVSGNQAGGAPSDHRIIVKAVYTGHNTAGGDADLKDQPVVASAGMPHTTYTQIMPWVRDFTALLTEFDPSYALYGLNCCNYRNGDYLAGDFVDGKYIAHLFKSNQDNIGWLFVFDLSATPATQRAKFGSAAGCVDNPDVTGATYRGQPGCIVASTSTFAAGQGSGFRWTTFHSTEITPANATIPFTGNELKIKSPYSYSVTLPSGMSSTASPCTMGKPLGNPLTDWPDATWTAGCSTIRVSWDPALTGGNPPGWPATLAALPGDALSTNSASFNIREVLRLLDKGADGNTWYVQRKWLYGNTYPYSLVAPGGKLEMLSPALANDVNTTGVHFFWDYTNGPTGGLIYADSLPVTHMSYVKSKFGNWAVAASGAEGTVPMEAQPGTEPARLSNPGTITYQGDPLFYGMSTSWVESHPSASVSDPADAYAFSQAIDNHPYLGDFHTIPSGSVSLVGGQLYRIRGTTIAANYKLLPYFANSGSRAMREVSGPGCTLATDDSTPYQWAVVLRNGECYPGSLAGDIYFNASGVVNQFCTNNWALLQSSLTVPNDICVSGALSWVHGIITRALVDDRTGLQHRLLSHGLDKYDQQSTFWNSRMVPDGSWAFTQLAMDSTIKLIQVPMRSVDRVNRQYYVPVTVKVPRLVAGSTNAVVQFGYGENGPTGLRCTTRQETCVAVSSSIDPANPFYFEQIDTYAGASCVLGCTITIPALPGRVLYYRVLYRDANGSAVLVQPMRVQAVP